MEKDIGKIKKNDTTDIVVRVDEFKDKKGLTIREYVTSEKYTGFTRSGVRISAEDFIAFRDLINSIDYNEFMNDAASSSDDEKTKKASKEEEAAAKESLEAMEAAHDAEEAKE